MSKSIFAKTFGDLIEVMGGTLSWSIRLGVEHSDLEKWLNDDGVPPERVLRSFYDMILLRREPIKAEQEQRQTFMEMLEMRSRDSCIGDTCVKMHPSVGHYLLTGLRESLNDALATVPTGVARDIIMQGIRRCVTERPE